MFTYKNRLLVNFLQKKILSVGLKLERSLKLPFDVNPKLIARRKLLTLAMFDEILDLEIMRTSFTVRSGKMQKF